MNNDQSVRTLSPDQHVFPVVFHLPQGLPSSFRALWNKYINGSIGYKLIVRTKPTDLYLAKAKVATRYIRGNREWPSKTKYFSVINPDEDSFGEPINEPRPAYFDKEFNIKQFYFLPRGFINVTVRLETDRIRPGETIYSFLTFDTSKSKVEIEGVEVYISTIVELYAGRNRNYQWHWFVLKTPSIKGPPVPSGLKREVRSMSYVVPVLLPRTFQSEMMQVWHRLVIKFIIPHCRNQELRLPFKIHRFNHV